MPAAAARHTVGLEVPVDDQAAWNATGGVQGSRNQQMLFPTLNDFGLIARGAKAAAAGLTAGENYLIPGFVVWL